MYGYESNSVTGTSNLSGERRSALEKNDSSSGYLNHTDPERWKMQRDASDAFSRAFNKNVKHVYNRDPRVRQNPRTQTIQKVSRLNERVKYGERSFWGSSKSYHGGKLELVMLRRDRIARDKHI